MGRRPNCIQRCKEEFPRTSILVFLYVLVCSILHIQEHDAMKLIADILHTNRLGIDF